MITPPTFPSLSVLLVDSSAFSRRLVRGMLNLVGIRQVVEAEDGEQALKQLERFRPGLIIVEWEIPIVPAFHLISLVRDPQTSSDPTVPVIGVTNVPTRRLIDEASTVKVEHILRKPFSPKVLWVRIAVVTGTPLHSSN